MKTLNFIILISLNLLMLCTACKKEDTEPKSYRGNLFNPTVAELQSIFDEGYTQIGGSVTFAEYNGVPNLNLLSNITYISNGLQFYGNEQLTSLKGLSNLYYVMNGVQFNDNPNLLTLDGIDTLSYIVGGILSIGNNQQLNDISALQNMQKIENLNIINNDSLKNIDGLGTVSFIGNLRITDNTSLIDFCSIMDLAINDNIGSLTIYRNAFNPTKEDIIAGNCSQ